MLPFIFLLTVNRFTVVQCTVVFVVEKMTAIERKPLPYDVRT